MKTTDEETTGREGPAPQNFDAVYDAIYEDLRKRASRLRRDNRNLTMMTTEIVNETYVNLRQAPNLHWSEIRHFKSIVVLAMRRLMVDLARKKHADKRGGQNAVRVPIEDVDAPTLNAAEYVLDLNRACDELAKVDSRKAAILELKYFGGLSSAEIAEELEISESTILRDLRLAEAWLRSRLPPSSTKS